MKLLIKGEASNRVIEIVKNTNSIYFLAFLVQNNGGNDTQLIATKEYKTLNMAKKWAKIKLNN